LQNGSNAPFYAKFHAEASDAPEHLIRLKQNRLKVDKMLKIQKARISFERKNRMHF
jgi:hypothetical protein